MDIFEATKKGDVDAIRQCLANGEDVNAKDNDGYTALIWASQNGHLDIAELLIRSEADVNVKDNNGWTALMRASQWGYADIANLLLRSGCKHPNGLGGYADVNAKNNFTDTALILASENGHADAVELLLRSGADVNAKNNFGNTALILASWNGHADIAELIVSTAMRDPDVMYQGVALSSFVPRSKYMNARDYAGLVAKVIPLYLNLAVANAMFGRDMQRDVEEILGGKKEKYRKSLTEENTALLTKLLKTLRSIDYTDRVKSKDNENTVSVYDMEL